MMVKYTEFELSIQGGAVLYGREWQPENKIRGVICLIHGLGEHSGRYVNMAQYLTQAGYGLLSYDQRGHGKSFGRRGHTSSYDTLLDDIDCFRRESFKRFPDMPSFLYGHSLGGNLVLNYVLRRRPRFTGVIVTSPWLKLVIEPPTLLRMLVRYLNNLWPTFSLPSGLNLKSLSRDLNVVEAYKVDPLVHKRISVRLFVTMDQAGRWALENAAQFDLPLLLMHGGGDRITSSLATEQFATNVPKDCNLKIWQGLFHELHNEPEKEEIIAYILNWLEQYS